MNSNFRFLISCINLLNGSVFLPFLLGLRTFFDQFLIFRAGYQSKWTIYGHWCHSEGHSISRPSLPKIADFLFWLRRSRKLSVSAILGYRSMLAAVFWFKLPEISTSPILQDLMCSFKVEGPVRSVRLATWDLEVVLRSLRSSSFEPLSSLSLCSLTKKVLFFVSLATAKKVSELQALSNHVSSGACVAYVPEYMAKTELELIPFLVLLLLNLLRILRLVWIRSSYCVQFERFANI